MEQRIFSYTLRAGEYSIPELEEKVGYRHLAHSTHEEGVFELGLKAKATSEQETLGARYIDAIRSGYIPQVSLHALGEKVGYGLFAEEEISQGAYVGEYTGHVRQK